MSSRRTRLLVLGGVGQARWLPAISSEISGRLLPFRHTSVSSALSMQARGPQHDACTDGAIRLCLVYPAGKPRRQEALRSGIILHSAEIKSAHMSTKTFQDLLNA